MTGIVERIADAIEVEYPFERFPNLVAVTLAATAEAEGMPLTALLAWISDRRHPLTVEAWREWCARYRVAS